MKFFVTGVSGFLGSALANQLSREGHIVRGLDNLSISSPNSLSPEIHFSRGDINDRPKLWTLLQDIDCVYHLAARVLVPESILHPREYNEVNVGGTVTLMEAMRDVGVRRVVFVSSGAIYGEQAAQPLKENMRPNPKSPYAVSKLAAEYYVHTIGELWGIETTSLRVFNAYGPGQQLPPAYAPVILSFLKQASMNGTMVINGDGQQTRDYVYIDDIINALVSAATAEDINQRIINIGSGTETSIRELVQLVKEITNQEPEIVSNPNSNAGPRRMCADISLARQLLNYEPKTSLLTGLRLTLEHDERLNINGHTSKH